MSCKWMWAPLLCGLGGSVQAQQPVMPGVTLYGDIDQYLNYMESSSGTKIKGLEDGAFLRSRLGFRGVEDLGDGWYAKFVLEMGLFANSGTSADASRSFDRQSWVSILSPYGELRFGRQNTAIFYRGDYIDFTTRTLGSMVNNFGVPSRYDNDIAYLSPRWAGVMVEAHYAPSDSSATGSGSQAVYQAAIDYLNGPYRVGYAGIRAKAPQTALYPETVRYDNAYANYDYGAGKIYLAYIHTNNSTSTSAGNNAGNLLGGVGALVVGSNPDVTRFYNITQVSADYRVTALLRVGALYGRIKDLSGDGHDASGGAVGGYYDLSKRTMLYSLFDRLLNRPNAGFRPQGSAGLPYNFTNPNDVNGKSINGFQLGILHRF